MENINKKITVGVFWNLANLFMARGSSIIFILFLARLLAPEAFGLVAMVAVLFELSNAFINSGFGAALIRAKTVSRLDLNTVFYTNLLLSGAAYIALYFSAPFIAGFYDQPELASLVKVMGLVVFINAAKLVQTAVLSREMDFKSQMKANTLGVVVSGCMAVFAAWSGWGVWSLVVQMLTSALVSAFVLWSVSQWRPALQFSSESFIRLFSFGKNLLLEGILIVLLRNSYLLVIGKFFSAEVTGLYFFAKKINDLISMQLTEAVKQATFPALSTLQNENSVLREKYRQILQLTMFLIAPIMALLAALAPVMFDLLFDDRWAKAVIYLQLLCVVGCLYPLHSLNVNLLNVKGRSDLVLKVGFVKKATNLVLLFLAIPYGVIGIVLSQVIGSVLALAPNTYYSVRLVEYSFAAQFKDVIRPILAALFSACVSWLIVERAAESSFGSFFMAASIGLVVYFLVSIIIRSESALFLLDKIKSSLVKTGH